MNLRIPLMLAALCSAAPAGIRSGKAEADWIVASATYQPGSPLQTAIRLKVDPGWHTYWSNPGEGGMKFSVTWQLPRGWTASEPGHPAPKSFLTGGLAGYGYEGTVIFPVTLNPPPDATGPVKISAKASWLTCDDSACIPGKADLELVLEPGPPLASGDAPAMAAALDRVPRPLEGATLELVENGGALGLTLALPQGSTFDPEIYEVFPETPQALDPATPVRFRKTGSVWSASATKSEYAAGPLKSLVLVLAGEGVTPVTVAWTAKTDSN